MSRFISAGTDEEPTERNEAWLKAQTEIEARRREKAEVGKQEGGKSLYETLQTNKAAKQEQFEESIRLRNQFRSLDEDEAEFLDSVLESTRAKEAEVKKQTTQQLDDFRRQQEEAEKAARQSGVTDDAPEIIETRWAVGPRKRKKGRDDALGGIKLRRTSTVEKDTNPGDPKQSSHSPPPPKVAAATPPEAKVSPDIKNSTVNEPASVKKSLSTPLPSKTTSPPSIGLGLAAYSSDEDE